MQCHAPFDWAVIEDTLIAATISAGTCALAILCAIWNNASKDMSSSNLNFAIFPDSKLVDEDLITSNKNESEASISKIYFDLTNIIMEQKSINTYQSAINLRKYCSEGNGAMLLISGKYHSLRSFLTFKTNKCNIKIYKYNRKFTYDLFIPSLSGLSNFNQVIYELSGLFYYTITNKIKII